MAHSSDLAARIRSHLADRQVEESRMFGSLCFMVNRKMCVCAGAETMLCRLSAADYLDAVERGIGQPMVMNGRTSRTYVHIGRDVLQDDAVLTEWLDKALAFNHQLTAG